MHNWSRLSETVHATCNLVLTNTYVWGGGLSATNKIVVDCSAHLVVLLVSQVKHSGWILFAPVFEPVHLDPLVLHGPIEVNMLPGVVPDTVFIEPMILCDAVVEVQS